MQGWGRVSVGTALGLILLNILIDYLEEGSKQHVNSIPEGN